VWEIISMRDFLCELKLPAVLISVVTIVWCTALRSHQAEQTYFPPDDQFTRLHQARESRDKLRHDETVRLELEP
jgi:hypothetical protein